MTRDELQREWREWVIDFNERREAHSRIPNDRIEEAVTVILDKAYETTQSGIRYRGNPIRKACIHYSDLFLTPEQLEAQRLQDEHIGDIIKANVSEGTSPHRGDATPPATFEELCLLYRNDTVGIISRGVEPHLVSQAVGELYRRVWLFRDDPEWLTNNLLIWGACHTREKYLSEEVRAREERESHSYWKQVDDLEREVCELKRKLAA